MVGATRHATDGGRSDTMQVNQEVAMSLLARPLTYDDLCQLPDDSNRYEIIGGELIASPSPNRSHQKVSLRLTLLIAPYVDARQLGEVYVAPVDVRLSPHNIVEPDLLFIRQDRLGIYGSTGPVDGAPDLVVEIVSPSSRVMDRVRKAALYADSGVPEYWLVDPEKRELQLLVLQQGQYAPVEPVDERFHSTVIPGLVVDPATLFAGID
jgi:Uma2 family endonuclease